MLGGFCWFIWFCLVGLGFLLLLVGWLGFFYVHSILCKLLKISPTLRCMEAPVNYPYCSLFKGNTQSENIFSVAKKFGIATLPRK